MATITLNWTREPLTMKFSLDSERMNGDYGVDQGRAVSALSSIPKIKFDFKIGRFFILDREAISAIVAALASAGFTVEHDGSIPQELSGN